MRSFFIVWLGQVGSLFGSSLTGFALGVWVYEETGAVTLFSLIMLASILPGLLMAPVAGALVDRWPRRRAMLASDTGEALCSLVLVALLFSDRLEIWHIYPILILSSTLGSLQWPAYSAATTMLVPKRDLGRASGMVQTGQAAVRIIAPLIAGALYSVVGLRGVILLDFATYLFAVSTLLMVKIPDPPTAGAEKESHLGDEVKAGWSYLAGRRGLVGLIVFFAIWNFFINTAHVLSMPLVLSFASAQQLGIVASIAALGSLLGGATMGIWGGPVRRVLSILVFATLAGAFFIFCGLAPSLWLIGAMMFGNYFCMQLVVGTNQVLWQNKIAPEVQGRVFALRRLLTSVVTPVAFLAAGPLADHVFEPLMAADGALAGSLGNILGVGPGRGIGLMIIVCGLAATGASLAAFWYRPITRLEDELPDEIHDAQRPATGAGSADPGPDRSALEPGQKAKLRRRTPRQPNKEP